MKEKVLWVTIILNILSWASAKIYSEVLPLKSFELPYYIKGQFGEPLMDTFPSSPIFVSSGVALIDPTIENDDSYGNPDCRFDSSHVAIYNPDSIKLDTPDSVAAILAFDQSLIVVYKTLAIELFSTVALPTSFKKDRQRLNPPNGVTGSFSDVVISIGILKDRFSVLTSTEVFKYSYDQRRNLITFIARSSSSVDVSLWKKHILRNGNLYAIQENAPDTIFEYNLLPDGDISLRRSITLTLVSNISDFDIVGDKLYALDYNTGVVIKNIANGTMPETQVINEASYKDIIVDGKMITVNQYISPGNTKMVEYILSNLDPLEYSKNYEYEIMSNFRSWYVAENILIWIADDAVQATFHSVPKSMKPERKSITYHATARGAVYFTMNHLHGFESFLDFGYAYGPDTLALYAVEVYEPYISCDYHSKTSNDEIDANSHLKQPKMNITVKMLASTCKTKELNNDTIPFHICEFTRTILIDNSELERTMNITGIIVGVICCLAAITLVTVCIIRQRRIKRNLYQKINKTKRELERYMELHNNENLAEDDPIRRVSNILAEIQLELGEDADKTSIEDLPDV